MTWEQTRYQPVSDQISNLAEAVKLLTEAAEVAVRSHHNDKSITTEAYALLVAIGRLREEAWPEPITSTPGSQA